MKKFLAVILLGLITWGVSAWVDFTQHTNWYYAGMIIGGIIALAIIAVMIKTIFRLFKWMFTSVLYLTLATSVFGILTYASILPVHIGTIGCVLTSGLLMFSIIRRIASKAQTSKLFNEIFAWVTGYRVELIKNEKTIKTVKTKEIEEKNPDRTELIEALKTMGYKGKEAQEPADYAIEQIPDASLEEKITCALSYIGSK